MTSHIFIARLCYHIAHFYRPLVLSVRVKPLSTSFRQSQDGGGCCGSGTAAGLERRAHLAVPSHTTSAGMMRSTSSMAGDEGNKWIRYMGQATVEDGTKPSSEMLNTVMSKGETCLRGVYRVQNRQQRWSTS